MKIRPYKGLTKPLWLYIMRASVEFHSALAQLVEQMTVNHWVAGSSPAGGAKQKKGRPLDGPFLFQRGALCWAWPFFRSCKNGIHAFLGGKEPSWVNRGFEPHCGEPMNDENL
jgi:hypothetical protein